MRAFRYTIISVSLYFDTPTQGWKWRQRRRTKGKDRVTGLDELRWTVVAHNFQISVAGLALSREGDFEFSGEHWRWMGTFLNSFRASSFSPTAFTEGNACTVPVRARALGSGYRVNEKLLSQKAVSCRQGMRWKDIGRRERQ